MATKQPKKTREQWLMQALPHLMKIIDKVVKKPADIKTFRVSCGWPRGHARAIGQCFSAQCSSGGLTEMFISPKLQLALGSEDDHGVLDTLIHELIHAVVGCKEGHRGEFKRVAREIGLEGKLTATYVSKGSPLHVQLSSIERRLKAYPHASLDVTKEVKKRKWEPRIMYHSPTLGEAYRAFMVKSQVEEHGPPLDPNGEPMVVSERARNDE